MVRKYRNWRRKEDRKKGKETITTILNFTGHKQINMHLLNEPGNGGEGCDDVDEAQWMRRRRGNWPSPLPFHGL
jgi:hypothetical protein